MGGACGTLGKKRHACTDERGDLRERDSWEDLGIDGSIVLIIDVKMNYTVRT
jgi:hypothetical protein